VPYAAGGSIDLVARILAEGLTVRLGQTVVVDDRPGGNGVIGIGAVVKAKPDGYTLQMGSVGANVTPAAVQKDYPFDPLRDYVPVAMVAEWSAILVVKKDLPVSTLAEFVAYAKARPGALNFGTTGTAASPISSARCSCSRPASRCSTCNTRAERWRPPT
jgi:tripartite-type tricarboxylate transporter receptor subunit TctC